MPSHDHRPGPSPEEVRAVVRAVVAGVVMDGPDGSPGAPAGGGEAGALAAPETEARALPPPPTRGTLLADVALGADHAGFHLKQRIGAHLGEHGFTVLSLIHI